MSLYNMINGVNPYSLFLIPMLGEKHPDDYPRFRNCWAKDEDRPEYKNHIFIYTRVGGGNRGCGYGEEELYDHPNFVETYDDCFDETYATYVFSVPDEWKSDYDLIVEKGEFDKISDALKQRIDVVFPNLKGKLFWHEKVES